MAELKGPVQFTGSIGGIRVYYNKTLGKYIVAGKGGTPKNLIKRSPKLARQRENMSEFKECAKWGRQMRLALLKIDHLHQGYFFAGIMSMAKVIQKHDDVGLRGIAVKLIFLSLTFTI
jgi:hypothetical protein